VEGLCKVNPFIYNTYHETCFALLSIAAAFVSTVVGNTVTSNYAGQDEKCGDGRTSCGPNLGCVDGVCKDVSSLKPGISGCVESLNKMGANVKIADVVLYRGYCFTNSCRNMEDRIKPCDDRNSYCGGGCKYCIKTIDIKCSGNKKSGLLGRLLSGLLGSKSKTQNSI
jgi:hypothetical protein